MALVPAHVCLAEMDGVGAGCELLPEEAVALGDVSEARRREFTDGRSCARAALAMLGLPDAPVRIGSHREPLWPPGVVGSITHCDGYRAAAVARSCFYRSLGLDAEPNQALPPDLHDFVMRPEERAAAARSEMTALHQDRLVFCAKESFYKAWFPLVRRWLDFTDVAVTFSPERASFRVELRAAATEAEAALFRPVTGRFKATESHIVTLYAVEAPQPSREA